MQKAATEDHTTGWLAHFPVPMFATVMGVMGFALALQNTADVFPAFKGASWGVLTLGVVMFMVLALIYLIKCLRHAEAVMAEWQTPAKQAFFPAISISMLLISTGLLPIAPGLARLIWWGAAGLQVVLTLSVVSAWISHRSFEVGQLTPAWFIPPVGNVIATIAGAQLGYFELSWLFFSVGLVFWMILLALVFNRLIFHDPIPGKLLPTLVILVAPPALGFIAYLSLTGHVDGFARFLINVGYGFAALVVVQVPKFRRLPFALPWWALSFPVAALTVASFQFAATVGSVGHLWVAIGLLGVLSMIMVGLTIRTVIALVRGEICVPEG
ncbi:SLAC1 anion channel family protein [Shimia abyssi]|uniref:Tellurite resistance protein n=1 Tax=Shimia abyssi TaxID=1662395 RepID=A0A2P8F6Q7_9RHOB|nr:SLAC1 anion channel family protein [Shimia abyssi]PSL17378.1 tellurite resistance protein [Shimia abyssi]